MGRDKEIYTPLYLVLVGLCKLPIQDEIGHDLAILTLSTTIKKFNTRILPVCLPKLDHAFLTGNTLF